MTTCWTSKLIDADEPRKSLLLRKPLGRGQARRRNQVRAGRPGLQGVPRLARGLRRDRQRQVRRRRRPAEGGRRAAAVRHRRLAEAHRTPRRRGATSCCRSTCTPGTRRRRRGRPSRSPPRDRMVWGKGKLWQHTLTLLAARRARGGRRRGPPEQAVAAARQYLVKVHVDRRGTSRTATGRPCWAAPICAGRRRSSRLGRRATGR